MQQRILDESKLPKRSGSTAGAGELEPPQGGVIATPKDGAAATGNVDNSVKEVDQDHESQKVRFIFCHFSRSFRIEKYLYFMLS